MIPDSEAGAQLFPPVLSEGARSTLHSSASVSSTTEVLSSTALDVYRPTVEVEITIAKTGSPTRIQFLYYWSSDGGTNYHRTNEGWEQAHYVPGTAVSGTTRLIVQIPRRGNKLKIGLVASGTVNGSNLWTITVTVRDRMP